MDSTLETFFILFLNLFIEIPTDYNCEDEDGNNEQKGRVALCQKNKSEKNKYYGKQALFV